MFDTALALMSSVVTDVMTRGVDPKPIGNTLGPSYGTNRTYRAKDAMIWISAPEEHHQAGLWRVLGRGDLPADPRFATEQLRAKNVFELTAEIEKPWPSGPPTSGSNCSTRRACRRCVCGRCGTR